MVVSGTIFPFLSHTSQPGNLFSSQQKNPLAMAAESLAGAFTWKNNQVAPRMLGFKVNTYFSRAIILHLVHLCDGGEQELKRSSTRRSCMSIETTNAEEADREVEEEVIETDLLEFQGQRRWAFVNNNKNIPWNIIAGVFCHLEIMKTTT